MRLVRAYLGTSSIVAGYLGTKKVPLIYDLILGRMNSFTLFNSPVELISATPHVLNIVDISCSAEDFELLTKSPLKFLSEVETDTLNSNEVTLTLGISVSENLIVSGDSLEDAEITIADSAVVNIEVHPFNNGDITLNSPQGVPLKYYETPLATVLSDVKSPQAVTADYADFPLLTVRGSLINPQAVVASGLETITGIETYTAEVIAPPSKEVSLNEDTTGLYTDTSELVVKDIKDVGDFISTNIENSTLDLTSRSKVDAGDKISCSVISSDIQVEETSVVSPTLNDTPVSNPSAELTTWDYWFAVDGHNLYIYRSYSPFLPLAVNDVLDLTWS